MPFSISVKITIKINNQALLSTSNKKLANLLSDESFTRWIKGNASAPEKQRWEAWLQKDLAHRELKENAEMFYHMRLELDDAEDLARQLDGLNQRIDRAEREKKVTPLNKFRPKRRMRGYRVAVGFAITLLLSVVGAIYLYYPASIPGKDTKPLFTTVEVGYGETSSLKFSDGSLIRLNSKSTLRYKLEQFNSNRVEVWLEGEGYFDIAPNPGGIKREFIVHTDDGDVRVLGTKFNVNTRFHKTSVVLEEGRVGVSRKDTVYNVYQDVILEPGERAILVASSTDIVLQKVNVGMFTAWLDGEMEFENSSLSEIIASIEATYGVSLDVENARLLERRITGTIQNPDLKNLLTGLQKILDLQVKQINKKEYMITQHSIQNE